MVISCFLKLITSGLFLSNVLALPIAKFPVDNALLQDAGNQTQTEKPAQANKEKEKNKNADSAKEGKAEKLKDAEPTPKSADQVLEEILKQRPEHKLIRPTAQSTSSGQSGSAKWPEGWQIVSRTGRIIEEGNTWVFVFESDSPDNPEPRLKMIPNLKLEGMVRETLAAGTSPVFIVSGEVTVYFNENHLLTRLALRKPESTNLSK